MAIWNRLRPFGTFYRHLISKRRFGIFSPVLVCCIKKNLATLKFSSPKFQFYRYLISKWRFGIFSPVLVCCTKKNLATLKFFSSPKFVLTATLKKDQQPIIHFRKQTAIFVVSAIRKTLLGPKLFYF
jgi:hypothetical protein